MGLLHIYFLIVYSVYQVCELKQLKVLLVRDIVEFVVYVDYSDLICKALIQLLTNIQNVYVVHILCYSLSLSDQKHTTPCFQPHCDGLSPPDLQSLLHQVLLFSPH